MKKYARIPALALLAVLTFTGCSQISGSSAEKAPSTSMEISSEHGNYVSYETYQSKGAELAATGPVVLFFNAAWCPQCRDIDEELSSHSSDLPAGVTVVSVDYDSHTDLRKKYGVRMQHTFVQVDASGAEVKTWISTSFDALKKEISAL